MALVPGILTAIAIASSINKSQAYVENFHVGNVSTSQDLISQIWLNEEHGGGFYMSDDQWVRSIGDKGIHTAGQVSGGTVKAHDRLQGQHLQLEAVVALGSQCDVHGLVGLTGHGELATCKNGMWITACPLPPAPVAPVVIRAENVAFRWPLAIARCPDGKRVMGGGGKCTSAIGFTFVIASYPASDKEWHTQCDTTKTVDAKAESFVICQ